MSHTAHRVPFVAHEGGLAAPYISMPDDEAVDLAREHFGIDGVVTRLATEKDDTFRVDASDGRRYILKVANPSEDSAEISLQIELLAHVSRVDPGIPIPRVIPNHSGEAHFEIVDRAAQARQLRLMSYLDGTPLDRLDSTPAQRERVGEYLGRLRLATAGFSHHADTRVLAWDVKHLPGLRHLLDDVEDPSLRSRLVAGLERFTGLGERIARLRTQVLHNDFSRSNVVVDPARPEFVTGVIDFGDAVRTAVAIDVSTALLNQLPREVDPDCGVEFFADSRDVLRGYLRVADLDDEELRLIPHLVMGRVIARALLTLWRARLFPENATYILRNTGPGRAQLDWFLERSTDEVSAVLLQDPICT